jgi:hypothetical protein
VTRAAGGPSSAVGVEFLDHRGRHAVAWRNPPLQAAAVGGFDCRVDRAIVTGRAYEYLRRVIVRPRPRVLEGNNRRHVGGEFHEPRNWSSCALEMEKIASSAPMRSNKPM